MKKSFTMRLVVPLAALFAFASLSLAADEPGTQKGKSNRAQARTGVSQTVETGTDTASDPLATDRGSRETGAQRGRLPRHGQTPTAASEEDQWGKKKGDNKSGKSSADEDEDGGTPAGN